VEEGKCKNSIAVGDNGCGTLQVDIELKPGETKELIVIMGIGAAGTEGKNAVKELGKPSTVKKEFEKLKKYWHSKIEGLTAKTPDKEFNQYVQCLESL